MGHWEDNNGNWFWDEDELIDDIGERTIWETVDTVFANWVNDNYSAYSILSNDFSMDDLIDECYQYVVEEMRSSIIEGEDWYDYGVRYVWVDNDDITDDDDEPSYNRKSAKKKVTAKRRIKR